VITELLVMSTASIMMMMTTTKDFHACTFVTGAMKDQKQSIAPLTILNIAVYSSDLL